MDNYEVVVVVLASLGIVLLVLDGWRVFSKGKLFRKKLHEEYKLREAFRIGSMLPN